MIKISIITPCYNQEKYIAECIESVLAQTYTDWEMIIINDGSTDNSLEIINSYLLKDERIKLISQHNQGVVAARNNALNISKGEYIFPLDGDDLIAAKCLELLYGAMLQGKGDVIYSEVEYFGAETGILQLPKVTKYTMATQNCVVVSALYKKEDALKYGGYDSKMNAGIEDWEFWCNFVYDNKKFHKIPVTLFFYRRIESSRNSSYSSNDVSLLKKYIRKKHNIYSYVFWQNIFKILYKDHVTKSGRRLIKICKIPVWWGKA